MAGFWQQVFTFGAAGRVEQAKRSYAGVLGHATQLAKKIESKRDAAQVVLQRLVVVKTESLPSLRKLSLVANNLGTKERSYLPEVAGEEPPTVSMARIEQTLDAGSAAMSAAKGLAAGASTAMGAWALAGTFGAASTGTALGSLTGAAATNATLAWFGGGSLAAGGAGMAGGAAVLGGVVAVPALAVMGLLAHSKANKAITEIEEHKSKLDQIVDDMRKLELVIDLAERRASELILVIGKAREAFDHQLQSTMSHLYPRGRLSRVWRWLRKVLGLGYFKPTEVIEVQKLLHSAVAFAGILDQQVFDANGSVRSSAQ